MDTDEDNELAPLADVNPASELVLTTGPSGHTRILGARDFKHVYKQRARPVDASAAGGGNAAAAAKAQLRQLASVHSNTRQVMLHGYKSLGVPGPSKQELVQRKERMKLEKRRDWGRLKSQMANDKIYNLPKNVTY